MGKKLNGEAPVQAASRSQATGVMLLAVPRYPPERAAGFSTSRWDRVVMVSIARASTALAAAIAACS